MNDGRRDETPAELLGRRLFMARRGAGYSQEQLAIRCSLHRTEIGKIEKGHRMPRVDTLLKLAAVLEVAPGELLRGIEWVPPPMRSAKGRLVVGRPT